MRLIFVTSLFLACAAASFAQSDRGTITGTVSDPAGAVVAGAAIEARNTGDRSRLPGGELGDRQLHHPQPALRHL